MFCKKNLSGFKFVNYLYYARLIRLGNCPYILVLFSIRTGAASDFDHSENKLCQSYSNKAKEIFCKGNYNSLLTKLTRKNVSE